MANYTLTYASLGAATGPFDITDQDGNVIASGVSKAELLAGYSLSLGSSVTSIKVASTGACTNFETIVLGAPPATTTTTASQSTGNVAKAVFCNQTTSTSDCPGGGGTTFYNVVQNQYCFKDSGGANVTANVPVEITFSLNGTPQTPESYAANVSPGWTEYTSSGDCENTTNVVTSLKVNGVTFVYNSTTDEWAPQS
jgi:hypothetical protein